MKLGWFGLCVFALVLCVTDAPLAGATESTTSDPAAKQITQFYDVLVDTMKRGPQLGIEGRYKQLAPAIDAAFDIPLMTQFTVGPSWANMSASDHANLVAAFRRMTVANYAANFGKYSGENFSVDANVLQRGSDKIVQSKLTGSGKPVAFLYRMRQSGADWKIIDVLLDGFVSELAMRRSDFAATVASGGATALTKKLNDLADALLKGTKKASATP